MSELDLDAIRARADAATAGPWKLWGMSVLADPVGDSNLDTAIDVARTSYRNANGHPRTNDADFIAAARTDVPALITEVERLRAAVQRLTQHEPFIIFGGGCGCGKPIADPDHIGWMADYERSATDESRAAARKVVVDRLASIVSERDEPANAHQQPRIAPVAANGASVGESNASQADDAPQVPLRDEWGRRHEGAQPIGPPFTMPTAQEGQS